jgi:hypothetical protein
MADWPEVEELERILNVDPQNTDDFQVTLDRVLASAIAYVKSKVGNWADTDEPDDNMAQAALRIAELLALRPETAAAVAASDPTVARLLLGRRRRFGIS